MSGQIPKCKNLPSYIGINFKAVSRQISKLSLDKFLTYLNKFPNCIWTNTENISGQLFINPQLPWRRVQIGTWGRGQGCQSCTSGWPTCNLQARAGIKPTRYPKEGKIEKRQMSSLWLQIPPCKVCRYWLGLCVVMKMGQKDFILSLEVSLKELSGARNSSTSPPPPGQVLGNQRPIE